jgi:hypothetical protein
MHQRLQLLAPLGADECVQFVDNKECDVIEDCSNRRASVAEHGF